MDRADWLGALLQGIGTGGNIYFDQKQRDKDRERQAALDAQAKAERDRAFGMQEQQFGESKRRSQIDEMRWGADDARQRHLDKQASQDRDRGIANTELAGFAKDADLPSLVADRARAAGISLDSRTTPFTKVGAPVSMNLGEGVDLEGKPAGSMMAPPTPSVEIGADTSYQRPRTAADVAQDKLDKDIAAAEAAGHTGIATMLRATGGKVSGNVSSDMTKTEAQRAADLKAETDAQIAIVRAREAAQGDATVRAINARGGAAGAPPTGRPVVSSVAPRMAELATSLDDADALRDMLDSAESGATTTGVRAKAGALVPNFVSELTGMGMDAKKKQAMIDRVKQVIGKALEGGVLRKEDELKYTKILPTIGDPPELMRSKLDGLHVALKMRMQNEIEALADGGYDVSAYEARLSGRPSRASAASPPSGRASGAGPGAPVMGEERMINGKLGRWDGKGWAEVVK